MSDFILGVAGHVDHGKTSLTYALTGVDTDRLAEEKRRGLTIEPGFAPLSLPDAGMVSLVDVPGHEKFIRNMLSCAAGLDAVLMVVAADDGVMPQTREHLDICTLLGIELGLAVITKTDLADEARLAQVETQIRALTAGTFLAQSPILAVSARSGTGLDALRQAISALGKQLMLVPPHQPFRLDIDRVFSKDGFGTIVTGTLSGDAVSLGDEATLYPSGRMTRVRAIQSHGVTLPRLEERRRAALNLAGVALAQVHRGDILAAPGSMDITNLALAKLTLLPHAPPLKTGARLRFYHGAGEMLCRCSLRGQKLLAPGESCPVRLRFDRPLAARSGDRFVIRSLSPLATVGGGVLTELAPSPAARAASVDPLSCLAEYHAQFPLRNGMNRGELLRRWGGTPAQLEELARQGVIKLRGPAAALPSFRPKYTPELARRRDEIEVHYRRAGLAPEENSAVDALLDGEVMAKLLRDKVLLPIGPRHRIHRVYYQRALDVLTALWKQEGAITLAHYRDALGISRQYTLLLLEEFDREGITIKVGDCRTVLVDGGVQDRL
jgi:small GTP-binding protein